MELLKTTIISGLILYKTLLAITCNLFAYLHFNLVFQSSPKTGDSTDQFKRPFGKALGEQTKALADMTNLIYRLRYLDNPTSTTLKPFQKVLTLNSWAPCRTLICRGEGAFNPPPYYLSSY